MPTSLEHNHQSLYQLTNNLTRTFKAGLLCGACLFATAERGWESVRDWFATLPPATAVRPGTPLPAPTAVPPATPQANPPRSPDIGSSDFEVPSSGQTAATEGGRP